MDVKGGRGRGERGGIAVFGLGPFYCRPHPDGGWGCILTGRPLASDTEALSSAS